MEVEITYYPNGQIQFHLEMKNGIKHGYQNCWWSTGDKCFTCVRLNGLMHGVETRFHVRGTISYINNWKNDSRHGSRVILNYK